MVWTGTFNLFKFNLQMEIKDLRTTLKQIQFYCNLNNHRYFLAKIRAVVSLPFKNVI